MNHVSIGENARPPLGDDEVRAAARLKLVLGVNRRVVAVAGLAPTGGSSLLVARLGEALAAIDEAPILIIDGNVAEPFHAKQFGISAGPGFLGMLAEGVDLDTAVQRVVATNLFVLPLGQSSRGLASLLTVANSNRVMGAIRNRFRYVLIDVGLVQTDPDGMLLASWSDGVLLAAEAGELRRHQLTGLREDLSRLSISLLGVVLTKGGA